MVGRLMVKSEGDDENGEDYDVEGDETKPEQLACERVAGS